MRNASDIFCLKELKDGDTSGTQMFSVNGKCHLTKGRRRRNLHTGSSSFEYGSTTAHKTFSDLSEVHKGMTDFVNESESNIENVNEDLEELYLSDGESVTNISDEFTDHKSAPKLAETTAKQNSASSSSGTSPKSKKSPNFHKLGFRKEEEKISESAMTRNPLTGAGVETEMHRKPKKGPLRNPKWAW